MLIICLYLFKIKQMNIQLIHIQEPQILFNTFKKKTTMYRPIKDFIQVLGDDDELIFIHVEGGYNFNTDPEESARFGIISDVEIDKILSERKDEITGAVSLAFWSRAEAVLEAKLYNDYSEQLNKVR